LETRWKYKNMKKHARRGAIWFGDSSHVGLFAIGFAVIFAEKSLNAEGRTSLGVIRGAVVTQEARVCGVVADDEVGAVVKAGITVAAQAELVLVALRHSLLVSQFDTRSVAGATDNTGSNCRSSGGIPVDSRSGSGGGHRSWGVFEALAGTTLCVKVFHFLDARPLLTTPPTTNTAYSSRSGHSG
jgi:hypothetical protein